MESVTLDTHNKSTRLFLVCMSMGAVAAALVYVGDALQWPAFNRRTGFFGTQFIGDFLYAINDPVALHIVAMLWFLYGSLLTGTLVLFYRVLFLRRHRGA
jgi:hypothetical protein